MSLQNPPDPFSNNFPAPAARQTHNKGCLIAILVALGLVMVCVFLAIIGAVIALRQTGVIGNSDVPQPNSQEYETQGYLNSLSSKLNDQPLDQELAAWIDSELSDLDVSEQQHEVTFDEKMFVEAVAKSDYATSIGIAERTLVRITIAADSPWPEVLSNYAILNTELLPTQASYKNNEFATVDILLYDDDEQAFSARWYLVKKNGQWKLYDWNRLEYGRRYSDELANYFSHMDSVEAEGYDEALFQAYDAWADYEYDEPSRERALQRLKAAEQREVLAADKAVRDLELVTYYEAIGEPEEALRLVRTVDAPKLQWGRLSQEAFLLIGLGRYEEALRTAEQFLNIAPNHPNGLEAASLALYYLDRDAEARPYLLSLLQLCPAKQSSFDRLLEVATEEDLTAILQLALHAQNPHGYQQTIIDFVKNSAQKMPAFLEKREESKIAISGLSASFWVCVEAVIAVNQSSVESHVDPLKRIAINDSDPFQQTAEELLKTHWINRSEFAEMINFQGPTKFVRDALYDYFNGEGGAFYERDPELMRQLENLEDLKEQPVLDLVRGHFLLESDRAASETALDRYLAAIRSKDGSANNDEEIDEEYSFASLGVEWAMEMLVLLYMRSDRPVEALERFGVNDTTIMLARNHFVSVPDAAGFQRALQIITGAQSSDFEEQIAEMRAALAHYEGKGDEADRILHQAIITMTQADSAEYTVQWQVMGLISLRVRYALLDRTFERLEKWDGVEDKFLQYMYKECLSELSDQAVKRLDLEALTACEQLLSRWSPSDQETQALVLANKLELKQAIEQTTDALLVILDAALASEDAYRLHYRITNTLKLLIETGRVDKAEILLEKLTQYPDIVNDEPVELIKAAIAIQNEDIEAVKRHLAECDPTTVGSWLLEGYVRRLLANQPDLRESLIKLFIAKPSDRRNPEGIILLQGQGWRPEIAQIRKWLKDALAGGRQLVEIPNSQIGEHEAPICFVVKFDEGVDLLVSVAPVEVEHYEFSETIGQRLADDAMFAIDVSIQDSSSRRDFALEKEIHNKIWAIVQRAVSEQTLAVYHASSQMLWMTPRHDLSEVVNSSSLLDRNAYQDVSLSISYSPPVALNQLTSSELMEQLQTGNYKPIAILSLNGAVEVIDCDKFEQNDSEDECRVKLKSDSLLYPDLRANQTVLIPTRWIQLIEK